MAALGADGAVNLCAIAEQATTAKAQMDVVAQREIGRQRQRAARTAAFQARFILICFRVSSSLG